MGLNGDMAVGYVTEFIYGPNTPSARISSTIDVTRHPDPNTDGAKFGLTLCYKKNKGEVYIVE